MSDPAIQVISVDNYSRGIGLDCEILENLGGCRARLRANEYVPPLRYIWRARRQNLISLFVETVPWWAILLRRSQVWVIWNHEILKSYYFIWLASRVLCKTRLAQRLARRWKLPLHIDYIGFTSQVEIEPLPPPAAASPNQTILHVGGQSPYKGTRAVLEAWLQNPDFPLLMVTCFGAGLRRLPPSMLEAVRRAPNIRLFSEPVEESVLDRWMQEVPIHLCPSSAEGFGHTLNRSRRAGALVVTTAAQPMRSYGNILLLGRRRGLFTEVQPCQVAQAVRQALSLPWEERIRLGAQNQQRFLEDHKAFCQAFAQLSPEESALELQETAY